MSHLYLRAPPVSLNTPGDLIPAHVTELYAPGLTSGFALRGILRRPERTGSASHDGHLLEHVSHDLRHAVLEILSALDAVDLERTRLENNRTAATRTRARRANTRRRNA